MGINRQAVEAAYISSRMALREQLPVKVTIAQLATAQNINVNSAKDLFYIVRYLLNGQPYTRSMSEAATDVLLGLIYKDEGALGLQVALQSVRGHLAYYAALPNGNSQSGIQACVARYEPLALEAMDQVVPLGYIRVLARNLNDLSADYRIGALQRIRVRLHGLKRPAGKLIFADRTVKDDWAYHDGGRQEAQFNIGEEEGRYIRHGLAFSFEPSRSLPDPTVLLSRVRRFNDYFRSNPGAYSDMRMWHYGKDGRSLDRAPGIIEAQLVDDRAFVVLGARVTYSQLDKHQILKNFDRLLPLYEYIEAGERLSGKDGASTFTFKAGCPMKVGATSSSRSKQEIDVSLRHNLLQRVLYKRLTEQHGADCVGTELQNGPGTSIDLVVKIPQGYEFYEIKTFITARACLREALGQLLEYAYWPGTQTAKRLIVVGEPPITDDGRHYIEELRSSFGLPIDYMQLQLSLQEEQSFARD